MLKHRLIVVAFTASLFPALASAADYGRPPLVVVSPWVGHYIGIAGGLAIGQIVGPGSRATDVGWTLGLGVEANMRPNVRGRIEYRYSNLGTVSFSSGQSDVLAGVSMTFR